ncbi:raffinose/stachyose/melibiose transport system permease protein [Cryobacterium sp. MP_M5]|uniref:carbohydrate ABC transporter permease n=1 Tax=unclassified Cryobacterium TaxID=2649013 RepID=UPI0018CBCA6F|nr:MULTISPECIES: carbohydrate ABC transporter permease [unclassified Cryobacterium]MBG6057216.1 raffinose/stachyose/melibiose transport system permease protein [Cryobacterium sp. MP_M3]MEC5175415.1 raffinose/stachyose/melibiose transport system permease protein [Cryobacterium sp. MP_M5]
MTITTSGYPRRKAASSGLRALVLAVALVAIIGPLALMVITSLKTQGEIFTSPIALPAAPSLDNYVRAWELGGIPAKALNSILVTVGSVGIATIAGACAGYVAARIRPRWVGGAVTAIFAFGLFLPAQSALVTLFVQMQQLGLTGTLWPIILVDTATQLPLTVVIFAAFFASLPEEIEEAAFVDGLGRFGVLSRIVIPIAKPAIATSIILGVVAVWNEFFVALIFATDPSLQTLPIGLAAFRGNFATDWGASLAYSTMVAVPVLILYVVLQRYIMDGVASGAVRG